MEKQLITIEQIKELLPSSTSLYYVDYNDNLNESPELLQECITHGSLEPLDKITDDWDTHHNIHYYISELKDDIVEKLEISREDVDQIFEDDEMHDAVEELICDLDDSTPIDDLLRNTGKEVVHYDTGYYMASDSWSWNKRRVEYEKKQIKKHLGIHGISKWDDDIRTLIENATGGGGLYIYFQDDIKSLIGDEFEGPINSIKFRGKVWIGIVNHCNGGGYVEEFHNINLKFPFNRDNLFLERSIKYNWTYSIAGMCSDWCKSTIMEFSSDNIGEVESSSTNDHLEQEKKYNETYRLGSCTFGDMDIKRHRRTSYENGFPAGTRCANCGNFWID